MSSDGRTAKLTNHGTRSHPSNSDEAYSEIADLMLALTFLKLYKFRKCSRKRQLISFTALKYTLKPGNKITSAAIIMVAISTHTPFGAYEAEFQLITKFSPLMSTK